MNFELSGRLIEKQDTVKVSETFKKREFVIEHIDNSSGKEFIDLIKFQLTGERCALIDKFNINDEIKVTFNIRGKRWVKDDRVSYFTNLEAWKIEKTVRPSEEPPPPPPMMEEEAPPFEEPDDLPF
jgi:Domain of unknown function (DUF3127)